MSSLSERLQRDIIENKGLEPNVCWLEDKPLHLPKGANDRKREVKKVQMFGGCANGFAMPSMIIRKS